MDAPHAHMNIPWKESRSVRWYGSTLSRHMLNVKTQQYVETNYLTRKQADDVLGGEDSWKNVDSIEGALD